MMPQFSPGYLSDHIDYSFKSVLLKLFVRNLQVELIIDYLIKKKKTSWNMASLLWMALA